jgi:hypothetical protein
MSVNSLKIKMAKPIRATPQLRKEEVEKFIKEMISIDRAKITKLDRKLAEEVKENSTFFIVH